MCILLLTLYVDLTETQHHGFIKNKGKHTLGLHLQSLISRALDDSNYVLMASLDLSATFDVVNTRLLLKSLRRIGLPDDMKKSLSIY